MKHPHEGPGSDVDLDGDHAGAVCVGDIPNLRQSFLERVSADKFHKTKIDQIVSNCVANVRNPFQKGLTSDATHQIMQLIELISLSKVFV